MQLVVIRSMNTHAVDIGESGKHNAEKVASICTFQVEGAVQTHMDSLIIFRFEHFPGMLEDRKHGTISSFSTDRGIFVQAVSFGPMYDILWFSMSKAQSACTADHWNPGF